MKWALGTLLLILVFIGAGIFLSNTVSAPEFTDTVASSSAETITPEAPTNTEDGTEFQLQLEEEVRVEIGPGIEGYQPDMLLDVFPGLEKSDFNGVKATVGEYVYEGEELMHEFGESNFVNSAAHAVSNEGLRQLLDNALERIGVGKEVERVNDVMDQLRTRGDLDFHLEAGASDGREWQECSPESKLAEMCTMEYAPVCGLVDVQCVTTPCPPIEETFSNACAACAQGNVSDYTVGECAL